MYIFYTDESTATDKVYKTYSCFIYGGIALNESALPQSNKLIFNLKTKYNIPPNVELKWGFADYLHGLKKEIPDTDPRKHLNQGSPLYQSYKDEYNQVKNEILTFVTQNDFKIIISGRPFELLKISTERAWEYCLTEVAEKFQEMLEDANSYGILAADEYIPKSKIKVYYHKIINLLQNGSKMKKLNRIFWIVPNIISELSPIHQINDIVLGCMNYYLCTYLEHRIMPVDTKFDFSKSLLKPLIGNFFNIKSISGDQIVLGKGISFQPSPFTRGKFSIAGQFLNELEARFRTDFSIL